MQELGELNERYKDFDKKNVTVYAISNDDEADAKNLQAKFPHVIFLADKQQAMAKAFDVIHPGMGPGGTDTNAPTTFLIDSAGKVRWIYRADNFIERATPDLTLAEIDKALRN